MEIDSLSSAWETRLFVILAQRVIMSDLPRDFTTHNSNLTGKLKAQHLLEIYP
jgi:hypothetical protein